MPDFTPPTKPIDFKPPTAPVDGPSVSNSQPTDTQDQQPQQSWFDTLFKFDPGMFSSMMQSAAHPQTLGDIGNLLIPAGVEGAIGGIRRIFGGAKAAEEAAPEVSAATKELPIKPPINTAAVAEVPKGDIQLPAETPQALQPVSAQPAPSETIDKLNSSLRGTTVKDARAQWSQTLREQRGQRIAKSESIPVTDQASAMERVKAMSGEYPDKPGFEPPKLEQPEVDQLMTHIANSPRLNGFEQNRGIIALSKVLQGEIPQDNEVSILRRAFGDETARALTKFKPSASSLAEDVVDFTKSMVTAGHFSFPFRQGAMMLHHPIDFGNSFMDMLKVGFAKDPELTAESVNDVIRKLPHYELAQEAGVPFTDAHGPLSQREEAIRSRLAERIPIYGKHVVQRGNLAYNTMGNSLRANAFETIVSNAANASKLIEDPKLQMLANPETNLTLAKDIANYVGAASGRGDLGSMEKYSKALNMALFSPRLQAARLQMIKMAIAPSTPDIVRKEALKSLLSLSSLGLTTLGLAKFGGADVSSDPTSADFGKAKIGSTRIDPWAGYQQYAVLGARAAMNQFTSSQSGKSVSLSPLFNTPPVIGNPPRTGYKSDTYKDLAFDFLGNKLNPAAKFAWDLANAHNIGHGKSSFDFGSEAASTVAPMVLTNLYKVSQTDPQLVPWLAVPNALGIGVENYGK